MEPFSIWLLTNAALLDRWQKQSQMLQDWTISWLKWSNRVTVLTLSYQKEKEIQQIYLKKTGIMDNEKDTQNEFPVYLGPPICPPCGYCVLYLGWGEGDVELCE